MCHPWLPRFGQRARFELGPQQVRISTFTAGATGAPVEVHVLFTHAWLLTVRAGAGNAMDRVHRVFGTFRNEIGVGHRRLGPRTVAPYVPRRRFTVTEGAAGW